MVHGPYLFVIVGEVKSGKSSFVNALLGAEICAVDPRPCTDCIQEIIYAESETIEVQGQYRKRLGRPIELLKTVAIVDTPGTNSIIKHHEAITRDYIPNSDLVVFVFPAKNPHAGTSWDLLSYAKAEWNRKLIFVLQQADLEPDHLEAQTQSVREYAASRGVMSPVVFATSAKWELDGKRDHSGFEAIRQYLRERITGGRHLLEKLDGQAITAQKVCTILLGNLEIQKRQLDADRALQAKIRARLGYGQNRSSKEIESLVARLLLAFDAITTDFKQEFEAGLGVLDIVKRSVSPIRFLTDEKTNEEWLKDLGKRLRAKLEVKVEQIASEEAAQFVESIRQLVLDLLEGTKQQTTPAETAGTLTKINDRRQEVLEGVQAQLASLMNDLEPLVEKLKESARTVAPSLTGGSLLAVVGVVIMCATNLSFVDFTGGVLTSVGVLVAGIALVWRRKKLLEEFRRGLDSGRVHFERDLRDHLAASLRGIYSGIADVFGNFDGFLDLREKELLPKLADLAKVHGGLTGIQNQVGVLKDSL